MRSLICTAINADLHSAGGFGSVPELLLEVVESSGRFSMPHAIWLVAHGMMPYLSYLLPATLRHNMILK